ncbi:hypothetical protein A8H31_19675 [Burkholderia thailandensis]|nr:hypothetical protein WJ27_03030 [Burkholderia thailandensis]AVR09622.1 hypothetical protein A8H31_19675 [Burkholderia thailandensis]KVG19768.1 hypothetical protein WJ28_04350 [Burkholderia thailandensis]NOK57149.1 hypothetical protein [Burkholderia thailandensis]PHH36079.1 hypothetical protein CRX59_04645 [Burkholderia thailandensis]
MLFEALRLARVARFFSPGATTWETLKVSTIGWGPIADCSRIVRASSRRRVRTVSYGMKVLPSSSSQPSLDVSGISCAEAG